MLIGEYYSPPFTTYQRDKMVMWMFVALMCVGAVYFVIVDSLLKNDYSYGNGVFG